MKIRAEQTKIGFIGTGVMGKSMASHIHQAGYSLNVYTRTREKAEELERNGARWCSSAKEIAAVSDVIITIVGYPKDVETIYLADDGILAGCKAGNIVIDMTTSSPSLARKICEEAKRISVSALDAPVSGGDIGAREAVLSIMVGGEQEIFKKTRVLFELMGKNIVYQGAAGSGQHCKMANQIAIASNMMGVCEAIRYAEKAGLEPETVLESITTGAAGSWSLSNLAPRIIKDDFGPGFFVKHFIKDMKIALDSCEEMNFQAEGLALAKSLYDRLAEQGGEELGTQALYQIYK